MRISDWSANVYSSDLQVWNADTAYNSTVGLSMDQERQRLLDIATGAPEYPAAKHPVPDVAIRIQSRAQRIRDEVMDRSQRFKDLTIQSVSYEALQKEWTMRLYVMGWNGLKTPVANDDSGEALTEACFDAVTREMGKEAARELYYHVSGDRKSTRLNSSH